MQKLNLIRLHDDRDNSVMVFNISSIMAIDMNNGTTTLYMNDSNEWTCNETTTKIYQQLKDFGFIRTHSSDTNFISLFNMFHLQSITRDDDVTKVDLRCGEEEIEISVNEMPEKIYNIIEEAKKLIK